jgi:acetyltransferase-like isoleucine patch superfamily enzyme
MHTVTRLQPYRDDLGNEIVYNGSNTVEVDIRLRGANNRFVIADSANIRDLLVTFWGDNGVIEIGPTTLKRAPLRFELRVGHESTLKIGSNVGCAGRAFVSAVEGADVTIGADVMFAKHVEVRCDDTHPIFDVRTGERRNVSRSIHVGEHVWLAKHSIVMGGVTIGDGSVVGFRSIVTRSVPNNCVVVGAPATVVRRDIAWERPETVNRKPGERYPREGEKSEKYWNVTRDDPAETVARPPSKVVRPFWRRGG